MSNNGNERQPSARQVISEKASERSNGVGTNLSSTSAEKSLSQIDSNLKKARNRMNIRFLFLPLIVAFVTLLAGFFSLFSLGPNSWWPPSALGWTVIFLAFSILLSIHLFSLYRQYKKAQSEYDETPKGKEFAKEAEAERSIATQSLFGLLVVTAGVVFVLWTIRANLVEFITGADNFPQFLIIFTLMGYFPLSYVAYHQFRSQSRIDRLKHDLELLGYGQENAEELYEHAHNYFSYLLFIALTMVVTMLGTSLLFAPLEILKANANTTLAMQYGFLGGYIFSAYLIYRRYSTNDLNPTVYLYCAFTMIAGVVFNYVAVEALAHMATITSEKPDTGIGAGLLAVLAFAIGYFPYLAVRWFNSTAYRILQIGQRRADEMPLGMLDGISDWHETRLRDNGIDDVQNLAAAEIRDLLVNTAFSSQQVIAWIDQANLYVYLEPSEIQSFRRAKIYMLSDFRTLWDKCRKDDDEKKKIAQTLQSTPEKLEMLYSSIIEGPNVHRVLDYWIARNVG